MITGLLAVWSVDTPMLRVLEPLRSRALVIGRELFPRDERVHERHFEITRSHDRLVLTDLGSSHGTYVECIRARQSLDLDDLDTTFNDRRVRAPRSLEPDDIVRIGNTLLVAVADVTPYRGRTHTRKYGLDVCGSLHAPCEQLAKAILDETSVAIAGPRWVTHLLGSAYLDARGGGPQIDIAARTHTLEAALAANSSHTVLLESPNALLPPEYRTLRNWLETDVRFITCMRRGRDLDMIPPEIRRWLAPVVIEIPKPRYDELPFVIHSVCRYTAEHISIQTSLIEQFLRQVHDDTEDDLFLRLGETLRIAKRDGVQSIAGLGRVRPERTTFRMTSYPAADD